MTGSHEGINCLMLHREILCGLTLNLKDVTGKVWKITILIHGGNRSSTHQKFKTFLDELEAEYSDLILLSNVRWLNMLKKIFYTSFSYRNCRR